MTDYIVTFPRTGSFFLKHLIENNLEHKVEKTHDPIPRSSENRIISVVRNPYDAIASYLAMLCHYREGFSMQESIDFLIFSYSEYCRYFISDANVIIDYESLIKNPEETMHRLCGALAIGIPEKIDARFDQEDMVAKEHLSSSKKSEWYKAATDYLNTVDLSNAIIYYNLVLNSNKYLSTL
jgi:hypothetical protein